MRLRSARITHYKSIEDSTEFGIDDITCLVGKNESGKTSILQALNKLKPVDQKIVFDKDTEYPRRHLSEFKTIHKGKPVPVTTTGWDLEAEDIESIHDLVGPKACGAPAFTVSKGYAEPKGSSGQTWSLRVDEGKALAFVLEQALLSDQEKAALAAIGTPKAIKELKEMLSKVPNPTEGLVKLTAHLNQHFKRDTGTLAVIDALEMPEFLYFTNYDRMPGKASIDLLIQKKGHNTLTKEDEIILGFLDLAGLSLDEIQNTKDTERLIAKLEGISNRITKNIFKYWTQNH